MKNNAAYSLAIFIALLLLAANIYWFYSCVVDDSYISLRYVQRLLAGKGLTWNDGEYVEGYSNFLWVILVSVLAYTGIDILVAAKLLGGGVSVLSFAMLAWYMVSRKIPVWITLFALAAFATCVGLGYWATSGLETPLVMFLLLLAAMLAERLLVSADEKRVIMLGIVLGLLCLSRPEGALYTLLFSAGLLFFSRLPYAERIRSIVFMGATSAIFFLSQLVFRLCYYHQWTANSALAKVSFSWGHVLDGVVYARDAGTSFLPVLLYCCLNKNNVAARSDNARMDGLLLVVIFTFSLFIMAAGGDIFPAYRFFLPLMPLVILWFAHCMQGALQRSTKYRAMAIAAIFMAAQLSLQAYLMQTLQRPNALVDTWKAMGIALKQRYAGKQPLVLTFAAGAIPYYSELPSLDGFGLNDSYITSHRYDPEMNFGHGTLGHELFNLEYIKSRKPDVMALDTPSLSNFCNVHDCKNLLDDYTVEKLDTPFDSHIYVRKDSDKVR